MRIIHLSDIHVWHWPTHPAQLFNKRLIGLTSLLTGRARRFPQARLGSLVARVASLNADHLLITGDFTTTALPSEFATIRHALEPAISSAGQLTVVPGNHDRYTSQSVKDRRFERTFGEFLPSPTFPWVKRLDPETVILGLDPCRPHATATGFLPRQQLEQAQALLAQQPHKRTIIACHYPVDAPPSLAKQLHHKRILKAPPLIHWLSGLGPHLYCCGHLHKTWAFYSTRIPGQLSLNPGAPLMVDHRHPSNPGFLEIHLNQHAIHVDHHGWDGLGWQITRLIENPQFFTA